MYNTQFGLSSVDCYIVHCAHQTHTSSHRNNCGIPPGLLSPCSAASVPPRAGIRAVARPRREDFSVLPWARVTAVTRPRREDAAQITITMQTQNTPRACLYAHTHTHTHTHTHMHTYTHTHTHTCTHTQLFLCVLVCVRACACVYVHVCVHVHVHACMCVCGIPPGLLSPCCAASVLPWATLRNHVQPILSPTRKPMSSTPLTSPLSKAVVLFSSSSPENILVTLTGSFILNCFCVVLIAYSCFAYF